MTPALESLGAQTFSQFDAIVVDDGSTDATADILREWARRDPRFRVVRHANRQYVGSARNTGLAEARSQFVAQADADDVYHADRLDRQMRALADHPDVGVIGADLELDQGRRLRFPASADAIRARVLWSSPFAQNTVVFNRAVVGDLRYDPGRRVGEDVDLWLRTVFRVPTMNLPVPLTYYRRHSGSLSNDLSAVRLVAERTLMQQRAALLGAELDVEAGIACNLGNRTLPVGAVRAARHIRQVGQLARSRALASAAALRHETRVQCWRLWRNYGRRALLPQFPALAGSTLRLFVSGR